MKVAIVYNEAHSDENFTSEEGNLKSLNFHPVFDLETSNPVEGFELMAETLRKSGYEAYTLNINDSIETFLRDYRAQRPDVVFNLVEIYKDRAFLEMSFAGLLDMLQIPYTGAAPLALGLCQRKLLAKKIFSANGIKTPNHIFINDWDDNLKVNLRFPLIVKPVMEDASVGIENDSVVENLTELRQRVEYVFSNHKQGALVEEYIDGRELNVAVFGDKNPIVLPISEIDFSEMPDYLRNIVSYHAKWDPYHESYHKTLPVCPAVLSPQIEQEANCLALKAFKAIGARDYARVDIRLSAENKMYVLELNPNPDLSEGLGFMRSAEEAGMNYPQVLKAIVDMAWKRRNKN